MPPPILKPVEIAKHNSERDCWLLIDNEVWDLTDFAPRHPGGAETILRYAGKNASKPYSQIHPPSLLSSSLPTSALKGTLNSSSDASDPLLIPQEFSNTSNTSEISDRPPLQALISTHDFAKAAEQTATSKTWAFYSSGATNNTTRDFNSAIFDRIWFRPRVMRDVTTVDTQTTILGTKSSVPFFVSPAAMVGLIHPEGAEGEIARGCASRGVIQCISTSASLPLQSITNSTHASAPSHPFFFQLYVSKNKHQALSLLHNLRSNHQIRALMITADAAWPGKREADERVSSSSNMKSSISGTAGSNDSFGGGLARHMSSFIDSGLNWEYVSWIRDAVGPEMPLVLKGVQSASDVQLAIKYGFQAVLLSNHGGRNLDTSPPAVLTLLECHARCPGVFEKIEILVDGGVRRGTDIVKMLCLGAKGVGVGRPFLYAANYGQSGVERVVDILSDELRTTMRNLGITDLKPSTLSPDYVNTGDIDHLVPKTDGHPYAKAYWNEKDKVRAKL